ncbi:hypothetical protein CJ030_MR7G024264 [Morella rubra]|uniref:Uncharacterized protein n=1 Tax=Morella rubra TaxID=262757 RepID=A0A6A1V4Z7_9ROSI|nr:hypothetical protein CJ030_MR7G024264 [Morella rubra]
MSMVLEEALELVPVAADVISHDLGFKHSLPSNHFVGKDFKVSSYGNFSKGWVESPVFSGAVSIVEEMGVEVSLRESVGRNGLLVGESSSVNELQLVACEDGVVVSAEMPMADDVLVLGLEEGGAVFGDCNGFSEQHWAPVQICYPKSKWVLNMVSSFRKMVGVSCEGYEDKLMSLFEELEQNRELMCRKYPSRSEGKLVREMKGLLSSINYEEQASVSRTSRKGERATLGC